MTAEQYVQYLAQVLYVFIFVDVAVQAVRRPFRMNVDVALFFGAATAAVALGWAEAILSIQPGPILSAVSGGLIMVLPYLFLRLVDDIAGVPFVLMRATELGLVLALIGLFVFPLPYVGWLVLLDAIYFVGVETYGAIVVLQTARRSSGVTKRRTYAIAAGSVFLGLVIVTSGLQALVPAAASLWAVLNQTSGLASGISYFLGFSPPPLLGRAWQAPGLRTFLSSASSLLGTPDRQAMIRSLEDGAATALGASGAAIGFWDADARVLRFQVDERPVTVSVDGTPFEPVLVEQRAILSTDVARDFPSLADLFPDARLSAALLAPIVVGKRRLGSLIAYSNRAPIFAEGDLELVRLLADQTGVILQSREHIEEAVRARARSEALAAAEAERRRLYSLLMDAPSAVCQLRGPSHVVEFANARYLQIARGRATFGGLIREAVPELEGQGMFELLDRAYATGEPFAGTEHRVELDRRGDGTLERAYFNFIYQPTRDAEGGVDGILIHGFEVTEQVYARQAVEDTANMIARLHAVTAGLSEKRTPSEVAQLVVTQALAVFEATSGAVAHLVDGDAIFEVLWEAAYHDERAEVRNTLRTWHRFPVALATPFRDAVRTGEAVFLPSREARAARYPDLTAVQDTIGLNASATIPLAIEGHVLGALYLNFAEERSFSESDRAFLLALARQCAQALDRARLDEAERQARLEAEAARERVVNILESISDRFIAVDRDWRFNYVNREAERFFARRFGKTRDDLVGRNFWIEMPDLVGTRVDREYHRAIAEQETIDLEEFSPVHGEWMHIRAYPSKDGLSIYFEDVTERKRAETEIRRLNEDLRRRTIELEAANKELEAFSYSVAHDLRAPLRAIDGFSRILIEEHAPELSPEPRRYLEVVRANAQQMGELIDDLLTFSRLSRQPLKRHEVHLSELVRQVLTELPEVQRGRHVDVTIDELPVCQADPALLKLVYANLLANALKFTRRRDVATIQVGYSEQGGERVYWVKDNGVGFDMRYAHKLFGVFQRLHRSEEYEGTGVGLAIVQRIIHRHGGRVWGNGEVDQGASFYFTIGEYREG